MSIVTLNVNSWSFMRSLKSTSAPIIFPSVTIAGKRVSNRFSTSPSRIKANLKNNLLYFSYIYTQVHNYIAVD